MYPVLLRFDLEAKLHEYRDFYFWCSEEEIEEVLRERKDIRISEKELVGKELAGGIIYKFKIEYIIS